MAKFAGKSSIWDGLEPKENDPPVTTHTHTQEHTHTPKIKETKDRRVQLLTYKSLIDKMDRYAKVHGLSRAEVFEQAVTDFLNRNT